MVDCTGSPREDKILLRHLVLKLIVQYPVQMERVGSRKYGKNKLGKKWV